MPRTEQEWKECFVDESTQWWLMAGLLVVAELATGTFYLLMIALGAVAGALAAHAGLGTEVQLSAAAVVAALTAGGWYAWKRQRQQRQGDHPLGTQAAPDLELDLGQVVQVSAWESDGTTHVSYRGAPWSARLKQPSGTLPEPGAYRICAMQGNLLLLEKV
jgi:membrane protein implicated in regulation of membrane protease activity